VSTIHAAEFRRRFRLAMLFVLCGMGVAVAAITAIMKGFGQGFEYGLLGVAAIGTAVMYGGLWYADRTKCPGCQSRLGLRANPYRLTGRAHHKCGTCGIVFDQQTS
jgi:hypothetical protein